MNAIINVLSRNRAALSTDRLFRCHLVGAAQAVFPALQGGPHNATIGALAFQLRQAWS